MEINFSLESFLFVKKFFFNIDIIHSKYKKRKFSDLQLTTDSSTQLYIHEMFPKKGQDLCAYVIRDFSSNEDVDLKGRLRSTVICDKDSSLILI